MRAAGARSQAGREYAVRVEYRQPGSGGTIQLGWIPPAAAALAEAEALVKDSDVAIVFVGLSSELEGEEMRGVNIPGFRGGDRTSLDLPEPQEPLVKAADRHRQARHRRADERQRRRRQLRGGARRGGAGGLVRRRGGRHGDRGDTLAGANNPAGRLPVTFYTSVDQLPPFTDYAMKGRTYRYFEGDAALPVRLRAELLELRVLATRREADGGGRRDPGDGQEHLGARRRRGRAAVRRRRARRRARRSAACAASSAIRLRAGESRQVTFTLAAADLPKSAVGDQRRRRAAARPAPRT